MAACRKPERLRTLRLIVAADHTGHDFPIQVRSMTTQSRDIQPSLDHLEAALEATCATLIALESARLGSREGTGDTSAAQSQIRHAIASLREAMAALRALHDMETSMLAFGFVLGANHEWSRTQARPSQTSGRQLMPRRTA